MLSLNGKLNAMLKLSWKFVPEGKVYDDDEWYADYSGVDNSARADPEDFLRRSDICYKSEVIVEVIAHQSQTAIILGNGVQLSFASIVNPLVMVVGTTYLQ